VMALFTPVMMVQVQVDQTIVRPVYGWQDHHSMVCDALGVDQSWYPVKSAIGGPEARQPSHRPMPRSITLPYAWWHTLSWGASVWSRG
jgi:hypothetical protein